MRIIVDLLGSDKGPECIFRGIIEASKYVESNFTVIGPKGIIDKYTLDDGLRKKIEVIDTEEYIFNDEEPTFAVRRKKNSSLVLGMKHLNEGFADGIISFGSTGAVLVSGLLIVKRIENVERAALTIVLPTNKGKIVVLDVGANIDCTSDILNQFAIMGSIYSKECLLVENPRVALLNIGSEEGKGKRVLKDTFSIIKNNKSVNFIGNIESREIFDGDLDVLVCDGFDGNLILKTLEGSVKYIMGNIKTSLTSNFMSKVGAMLIKPSLKNLRKKLDYKEYGACPMLGLNKVVFKGHGSSDERAVVSGILSMVDYIDKGVNEKIKGSLEGELK